MEAIILDEVNVKAMEYVSDESGLVRKSAKANFKSIGPKFGKAVQALGARIRTLTAQEIAELENAGTITLSLNGSGYTISREDVEIVREDIAGWIVESDGTMTVALDTELNEELLAEGAAREFVNRVQNLRKDSGLDVTDRILLAFDAPEGLREKLNSMIDYIRNETLAVRVVTGPVTEAHAAVVDINGEAVQIGIERQPS
jgi:isoleucyl-tRNA synthetase